MTEEQMKKIIKDVLESRDACPNCGYCKCCKKPLYVQYPTLYPLFIYPTPYPYPQWFPIITTGGTVTI